MPLTQFFTSPFIPYVHQDTLQPMSKPIKLCRLLLISVLLLNIMACGQKGALYLSEDTATNVVTKPVPRETVLIENVNNVNEQQP